MYYIFQHRVQRSQSWRFSFVLHVTTSFSVARIVAPKAEYVALISVEIRDAWILLLTLNLLNKKQNQQQQYQYQSDLYMYSITILNNYLLVP